MPPPPVPRSSYSPHPPQCASLWPPGDQHPLPGLSYCCWRIMLCCYWWCCCWRWCILDWIVHQCLHHCRSWLVGSAVATVVIISTDVVIVVKIHPITDQDTAPAQPTIPAASLLSFELPVIICHLPYRSLHPWGGWIIPQYCSGGTPSFPHMSGCGHYCCYCTSPWLPLTSRLASLEGRALKIQLISNRIFTTLTLYLPTPIHLQDTKYTNKLHCHHTSCVSVAVSSYPPSHHHHHHHLYLLLVYSPERLKVRPIPSHHPTWTAKAYWNVI